MRNIKLRFLKHQEHNPGLSDYSCFAEAIKNQKFSREMIRRWFNKIVNPNDYTSDIKKSLLIQLYDLSNPSRTTRNEVISALGGDEKEELVSEDIESVLGQKDTCFNQNNKEQKNA